MSRNSLDISRSKKASKKVSSHSPRPSVYDRLGPTASLSGPTVSKIETDANRYRENSQTSRLLDGSNLDNEYKAEILDISRNNQSIPSLCKPILKSENGSTCDEISKHDNSETLLSQMNLIEYANPIHEQLLTFTPIGDNSEYISGGKNRKINRSSKQISSVVHRGSQIVNKTPLANEIVSANNSKINDAISCELLSDVVESTLINPSRSCSSCDENDTSSDSISENDTVEESLGIGVEKGLSSISENSFSSVTSAKTSRSSKKKKKNHIISVREATTQLNKIDKKLDIERNVKKDKLLDIPKISNPLRFCSQKINKKHFKRSKSHSNLLESRIKRDNNKNKRNIQESNNAQTISADPLKKNDSRKHKHEKDKKSRANKKYRIKNESTKEIFSISKLSPVQAKKTSGTNSSKGKSYKIKPETLTASPSKQTIRKSNKHRIDSNISGSHVGFSKRKSLYSENCKKIDNENEDFEKENISSKNIQKDTLKNKIEAHFENDSENTTNLNIDLTIPSVALHHVSKRKHSKHCETVSKKKKNSQEMSKVIINKSQVRAIKKQSSQSLNFNDTSILQNLRQKEKSEIYDSLSDMDTTIVLDDDVDTFQFAKSFAVKSIKTNVFNKNYSAKGFAHFPIFDIALSYSLVESNFFNFYIKQLIELKDLKTNVNAFISNLTSLEIGSFIEDNVNLEIEKESFKTGFTPNFALTQKLDSKLRTHFSSSKGLCTPDLLCPHNCELKTSLDYSSLFQSAMTIYEKHKKS